MNIPKIIGLRAFQTTNNSGSNNKTVSYPNTNYGLTMPRALSKDTVSFGATAKMLQSRAMGGVSLGVARSISKAAEPMQEKIETFMNRLFGDLVATQLNPKLPVFKLCGRVKTPKSIVEKSATRQYNCKAEVLDFMTDLNGAKIVMRDGRKKTVEKLLSRFFPAIEKGEIELIEIENKRPKTTEKMKRTAKEQYDYASIDFLEKMQRVQEEKWESLGLREKRRVRFDMNDITEVNYSAIHFLFKFPGEPRPFELMLMGKDVHDLKELDDKLFKILNNKDIDKKYKPLVDIVKPLNEPGNKEYLEKFNQYRGEAFIFQREKDPNVFVDLSSDTPAYFLPLKSNLPPVYDLNNLNRIMLECENHPKKKK